MLGETLNGYTVVEKIGEGGMGIVYKGLQRGLDRTVALKFLNTTNFNDRDARHRFLHEAQAAGRLNHKNICPIYEICQGDDYFFLVMPLLEGRGLNEIIRDGPLRVEEMIRISGEIAEGLSVAHKSGVIHRDIKSGNIMVGASGDVVIMDFGLAKIVGSTTITEKGVTLGTPHSMSPEQAKGEKVDHRTDIWSLGVVMYEMLCGRLPFTGEQHQAILYRILNEEPEYPTAVRSGIPRDLEAVVLKALSKDPGERYQHCDEIIADFRRILRASERTRSGKSETAGDSAWKRRASAVMFTDIVGFSRIVHENENLGIRLLHEHREILRPLLAGHHGEEIETKGDAFLIAFPSTLDAVNCAIAIQSKLHERNSGSTDDEKIVIRIGIHDGDVIFWNGQIYGDAVNIASRIQARTPAGGIGVSEDVYRKTRNKIEYPFDKLGVREHKNISTPFEVYIVRLPWTPARVPSISRVAWRQVLTWVGVVAVIGLAGWGVRGIIGHSSEMPESLAILPFKDSSAVGEYHYLADGITRDLSAAFQSFRPDLRTASIFSTYSYKNLSNSPPVIARELGVRYVLDGTVRSLGNLIEIRAYLFDSARGRVVSETPFIGDPAGVPANMAGLTRTICGVVGSDPGKLDPKFWSIAGDPYLDYAHGLSLINTSTPHEDELTRAVKYLEQAVMKDSTFFRAQLALADAYVSLSGLTRRSSYLSAAEKYARNVLSLDTLNSTPLSILGEMKAILWEDDSAEYYLGRALTINPYDVRALTASGAMVKFTKPGDALIRFQRAREIEPLNAIVSSNLGVAQSMLRDFDNASKTFAYAIELNPGDLTSWRMLGYTYEKMSNYDAARRCYLHIFDQDPREEQVYPFLFRLLLSKKEYQLADSLVRRATFLLPKNIIAHYYSGVIRRKFADEKGAREAFMHGLDIVNEGLRDTLSSRAIREYSNDFVYRGLFSARLGRVVDAEGAVRRAVEIDGENEAVQIMAAKTYAVLREPGRMIDAFKKAKSLNTPEYDESYVRGEIEFENVPGLDSLLYYARK